MSTKKKDAKSLGVELVDELLEEEAHEATVVSSKQTQKDSTTTDPPSIETRVSTTEDDTHVINFERVENTGKSVGENTKSFASHTEATGRYFPGGSSPLEASLAQSQSLKIAQDKILELEEEINRLRVENEELSSAGEVYKDKAEELISKIESLEKKAASEVEIIKEEKEILLQTLKDRGKKMDEITAEKQQLESRIQKNISQVRVRERELENRLELVKLENRAMARTKDDVILDLKRQIDKLILELNDDRAKSKVLSEKLEQQHDVLSRTVKALRIALSMLEGEGSDSSSKAS